MGTRLQTVRDLLFLCGVDTGACESVFGIPLDTELVVSTDGNAVVGIDVVTIDVEAGARALCAQCESEMCSSAGGRAESRVSKHDKRCRSRRLHQILRACKIVPSDEIMIS